METTIITIGDINGTTQELPNKAIIKDAQRNACMSASFWTQIKMGKIPYVFSKDKNELIEATYSETVAYMNNNKGQLYWVTDSEYPELNEITKNAEAAEELKQSYLQKIEKFK